MAVWQWSFQVDLAASPHGAAEAFLTGLDPILLQQASWSNDIRQWGDIDSTVCEAVSDEGRLTEILIRLDLRADWRSHLQSLWEAAEQAGCRLLTHGGQPLHSIEEAAFEISTSSAAKFVDDPGAFLTGGG